MGYSPWGLKELDTTEQLSVHTHTHTLAFLIFLPTVKHIFPFLSWPNYYFIKTFNLFLDPDLC